MAKLRRILASFKKTFRLVLVGHDTDLGEVAGTLLKLGRPLPLKKGMVVCLKIPPAKQNAQASREKARMPRSEERGGMADQRRPLAVWFRTPVALKPYWLFLWKKPRAEARGSSLKWILFEGKTIDAPALRIDNQ